MENDPNKLWFRNKTYGWGWTPVSWQGWLAVLIYIVAIFLLALTLDKNSPAKEVVFTFILPVAILTALLIRIAYAKGEKPRWRWGEGRGKNK